MIDFVEREGLSRRSKCEVMLNGSACGVDLERFDPEKWRDSRSEVRNNLDIPEYATVIGTVARLTGDKGINELTEAFNILCDDVPLLYLLLVGGQEEEDRLSPSTEQIIANNTRVRAVGYQPDPVPFYLAMDIFCLPTYREGFGEVNLEAQALKLPVVSTNVIGPRESIEDGRTGYLVEPRSSEALICSLKRLIPDPKLRKEMGREGRKRVVRMFDRRDMIGAVVEHRLRLLLRLRSTRKQVMT
jgi:glycosyltransferase involved in cell wall biosynthesis